MDGPMGHWQLHLHCFLVLCTAMQECVAQLPPCVYGCLPGPSSHEGLRCHQLAWFQSCTHHAGISLPGNWEGPANLSADSHARCNMCACGSESAVTLVDVVAVPLMHWLPAARMCLRNGYRARGSVHPALPWGLVVVASLSGHAH